MQIELQPQVKFVSSTVDKRTYGVKRYNDLLPVDYKTYILYVCGLTHEDLDFIQTLSVAELVSIADRGDTARDVLERMAEVKKSMNIVYARFD